MNRYRKRTKRVFFSYWFSCQPICYTSAVNDCLRSLLPLLPEPTLMFEAFNLFILLLFHFRIAIGIDSIFDNLHASHMSRPKQQIFTSNHNASNIEPVWKQKQQKNRINDVSEFHELINAEWAHYGEYTLHYIAQWNVSQYFTTDYWQPSSFHGPSWWFDCFAFTPCVYHWLRDMRHVLSFFRFKQRANQFM